MFNHPWKNVFLAGLIVYGGIRAAYKRQTRSNELTVSRADWRDRLLIFLVFIGCILLPLIYLFTRWIAFADYHLPSSVPACGAVVMIAGLWLFWRSHADLGKNWSVTMELRKGHEVIKHGVYRWIRHPMYAAIFLFSVSQALILKNWLAGPAALVTFAALYIFRAPREELMLCEHFGDEYRDYMRQTGRLIPRFGAARK